MPRVLPVCAAILWHTLLRAAEPVVAPNDLPRVPPTPPDQALATFQVKPGFRIELAAAEPLVVDPIAMAFDEDGRLFVVEMRDYSERRDEKLGRIRLLEDTDGDGRFDKSTVFAEGLAWPTAVVCWKGGVFVGATPDIVYLKDTNGDGVADEREGVFTGFGQGMQRLNVQQLLNSFTWGLDHRIHGATGGNGGSITTRGRTNAPLELRGRDFSFDPRTLDLRAESGGGQYGLCFDNYGRKFVCSNSRHIIAIMYEDRYAAHNPFYAMPPAAVDIAVDGPSAEVYRISPDEPWRVVRTRWRVAGQVPGPIEGGGRASGYFTAATGITIYRGNAFPEDFVGDAFVADCGSNLIHRKKIRPDGAGFKAERPADEQKVEFLASTDTWFRPVQLANGPDGALYVADMYREVIEHPWSLPELLKKHLDLNSGNDRGRIYRIVPEKFQQPKPPRLGKATTLELVKTLEHPNCWHRDTAARLLFERQDKKAVEALTRLASKSKTPLGRLHALTSLESLRSLSEDRIVKAFNDADAFVRESAVGLSEGLLAEQIQLHDAFWRKLRSLPADPSPRVRYQLALTLGQISYVHKFGSLAGIIERDMDDPWMRSAVLNAADSPWLLFDSLCGRPVVDGTDSGRDFLRQLARQIGVRSRPDEVAAIFDRLSEHADSTKTFAWLAVLGEGLQQGGSSLVKTVPGGKLQQVFLQARRTAPDSAQPEAARVGAIQLLAWASDAEAMSLLLGLIEPNESQALQMAAIKSLSRFGEPSVGGDLLKRWANLTPRLRAEALAAVLTRSERVPALLLVLEAGTVQRADLTSNQIDFLRKHRDPSLRQRAETILGATARSSRQEVVDKLLPALQLIGDSARGQKSYLQRCASCHRAGGQGQALGPDLAAVRAGGKEKLLVNILDPNREVAPNYLSYLVETKDGESLLGIIASETGASLTLRQTEGKETVVLRSNLLRLQSQGLSAMPEGLEAGLSAQDVADLLEFIVAPEPERK